MKFPKFLKKKRNLWIIGIIIVLIIVAVLIFGKKNNTSAIQTGVVTKQNLQETVLSTGQVVSGTDLNLSFQGSGVVDRVSVQAGDKVGQGEVLASLNQSSALAALTSAKGTLAGAEASYEKLTAGATSESIQTAQDAVNSANQNLANAYSGALTALNTAYASVYSAYSEVSFIHDTYFQSQDTQGTAVTSARDDINSNMKLMQSSLAGSEKSALPADIDATISQTITSLNNVYTDLNVIRAQCDLGVYYYKVTATDRSAMDSQKTSVNTALTGITSLQQSIGSLSLAVQTAQDQLKTITAPPTQADIDLAKAQILSAQGQVDAAQATVNNSVIIAPLSGTITQVDIKVGEQAVPSQEVMILQDISDLHAEADVSEADVASLQVGQSIDYTFDALGPDAHFAGKVLTINPASTVIAGVVDYLVKGTLDNVPGIKPGMTANMTIMVAEKTNVLAVPSTAIINNNNNQYVRVIDNPQTKTYHEVQVQTGLQADGGLVEITSGLTAGQEIIIYQP